MEEMLKDKRFAHIAKDPKFRRIPKSERKVKIDDRFRSMFKDKKFKVKCTVDKRGRPVNQTSNENLRKYYDLSSSEESEEEEEGSKSAANSEPSAAKKVAKSQKISTSQSKDEHKVLGKKKSSKLVKKKVNVQQNDTNTESISKDSDSDSDSAVDSTAEESEESNKDEGLPLILTKNKRTKINPDIQEKLRDSTIDYARGEGVLLDDSSSDEESSDQDDDDDVEIEHDWGELDKEAETTDETTRRLAACNMDWDRIRAVDLLVLFHSFLPPGGMISSVKIYPSEYGLQRMKEEEAKGPIELVEADEKRKDLDLDDENEEGSRYHMEKMRQYQLNRLKYYYAVIECDSPETANKIYTECDGIEYESTSTKLDLRFIPDDMEFDHEPREVCNKLPEPAKYQPRQFTTTALQQVKVELTWDETNPERQEMTQKINSGKLDDIDESDMRAYLASGTSDEESEPVADRVQDDSDNSEVEETSKKNPIDKYKCLLKSIEDKEEAKRNKEVELEFTWGLGAKEKTEKMVKERLSKSETLTPFEEYLEKRKAKKKAKREERRAKRETAGDSENDDDDGDSVPSDVDMNDPYFAEEINERQKRNKAEKGRMKPLESSNSDRQEENARKKAELELLLLDKDDDAGKQHFDMKKVEEEATLSKSKKKRLKKKRDKGDESNQPEDDFQVDVADPRFAALYSSHHYNIDPADPHYRKTKGTEALIKEKLKRRADPSVKEEIPLKHSKTNGKMSADLAALVKSVKRNTKNILKPIK